MIFAFKVSGFRIGTRNPMVSGLNPFLATKNHYKNVVLFLDMRNSLNNYIAKQNTVQLAASVQCFELADVLGFA